ncbi:hypothetical protein ACH9EU_03585 [Kocuria sp. M1R5S2]|uniref:hypothetical protein n=1 Tax=Kocuria rhizosphaerae TaxID=3376285 RepID=UPI00379EED84
MTPPRPHPEDPDSRRVAATRTTATGLVCAAVALLLVGSGLWTTVAGVVAAAAGLGLGIAGLVRSRRTTRRGLLAVSAVAAIVLGTAGLLTGGARLALWPVTTAYEQCVAGTLTLSGTARCQAQLEEEIWRYLSGGSPAVPGDATGSPAGSPATGPAPG